MQSPCSETPTLGPALAEQEQTSHWLYQGATVLAILVFLMSFWSC
jgi:hypothetical protein